MRDIAVGAETYANVSDLLLPSYALLGTQFNLSASQTGRKILGIPTPSNSPSTVADYIEAVSLNWESPSVSLSQVSSWVDTIHAKGKKAHFAPIHLDFDRWRSQNDPAFVAVIQKLDVVAYQAQMILETDPPGEALTEDEAVARINEVQAWVNSINPGCELWPQLWFYSSQGNLRQSPEQMIRVFSRLPNIPVVIIGGGDNSTDKAWTRQVIEGLQEEVIVPTYGFKVLDHPGEEVSQQYATDAERKEAMAQAAEALIKKLNYPDPTTTAADFQVV